MQNTVPSTTHLKLEAKSMIEISVSDSYPMHWPMGSSIQIERLALYTFNHHTPKP